MMKNLLNAGFEMMDFMLMMILKKEIIAISLENIKAIHIEIVISE